MNVQQGFIEFEEEMFAAGGGASERSAINEGCPLAETALWGGCLDRRSSKRSVQIAGEAVDGMTFWHCHVLAAFRQTNDGSAMAVETATNISGWLLDFRTCWLVVGPMT